AVAAVAGMFAAPLAGWFAWPAKLLLTYMLDIVHLLASIPSIFLRRTVSVAFMLGFYVVVLAVILIARKNLKNHATNTLDMVK
ncbi:MAG TPA: hypothetical protein VFW90_04390, partial [Candidatus Saccharimonadales bacterium]|nr:hypothetical protein [Candidatus Saccharimonadales bacterium]